MLLCSGILATTSHHTQAAWIEAMGQAVVQHGDKQDARKKATQDAIRQALLFSGASVHSVQTLTNGLLADEQFEIAAAGEVNQLELIEETYQGDLVTVKIRADILPQLDQCQASEHIKTIATSYFPISHPQQALDGKVEKLGEQTAIRLKRRMLANGAVAQISDLVPKTVKWQQPSVKAQADVMGKMENTQFVLAAYINDISLHRPNGSALTFWKNNEPIRQFSIDVSLIDTMNQAELFTHHYSTNAQWHIDKFSAANVASAQFWQSDYGHSITVLLDKVINDLNQAVACHPSTGRVIKTTDNKLLISMGKKQGLKVGDELSAYQTEYVDGHFGNRYLKYNLYPQVLIVESVYVDSATVAAKDNSLISDIQANDFVATR